MKKKSVSQSASVNPRALIGIICVIVALLALFAFHPFPGASVQKPRRIVSDCARSEFA